MALFHSLLLVLSAQNLFYIFFLLHYYTTLSHLAQSSPEPLYPRKRVPHISSFVGNWWNSILHHSECFGESPDVGGCLRWLEMKSNC